MHALTVCYHTHINFTVTEQEVIVLHSDDDDTTTYTTIKVKADVKAEVPNGNANGNANGRGQRRWARPAKPEAGHLIAARLRLERLLLESCQAVV
jgi:hypothetical protein